MLENLNITPSQTMVVIGLLMIASELFLGIEAGLDLMIIGSTIIVGGFVGIFTGSLTAAVLVAAVLSVLYIALGRQVVKSKVNISTHKTGTDRLIGHQGKVTKDISPTKAGQVKIDDEQWRAQSKTKIKAGTTIKVTNISGVTLKVTPA